ncbi:MAG: glycosyltransferase family 9 protein [Chthoniobacterales bacterium]
MFEQNVVRCGVQHFLRGPAKILGGEHAAFQLARPLERLGLFPTSNAAHLFPSADDHSFARKFAAKFRQPIVALHPGSGSDRKNWPVEKWLSLGESLLSSGQVASLLIVGGEADGNQLRVFRSTLRTDAVHFAEHLPLPHLAAVLKACILFLGHDSGISHIAAAVGTQCVLLFGPTEPRVWAPANENVQILRSARRAVDDLRMQDVLKAASAVSLSSSEAVSS